MLDQERDYSIESLTPQRTPCQDACQPILRGFSMCSTDDKLRKMKEKLN
jgi:hypothetical protein